MASTSFLETRWLKRPRLGPPDVYHQDPKQKEDELTSVNVKQGFINPAPFNEECSSAHLYTFDHNKISQSFSGVLTQKQICNTFNDAAAKKRPQVAKENFSLVPIINSKVRGHAQNWFKDLSSNKFLSQLSKKVPVFSKKEDIFQSLSEYEVPLVRATWFIKMTAAYHLTQTDVKNKKRATNDPNSDWTQAICKFLREQLVKLNEDNQLARINGCLTTHINTFAGSVGTGAISCAVHGATTVVREDLEKQLQYISNLAHHMYTEGLLDRQEFLTWVIEEFEHIQLYDEIALSYFMPFILQYIEEVAMNHMLVRRMSFAAAHQLNWIFMDRSGSRSESPSVQSGRNTPANKSIQNGIYPTQQHLQQHCPVHLQSIAHTLACVIQYTVMTCPGALVWYPPVDSKICGSPMDLLPCAPSSLLLPEIPKYDNKAQQENALSRSIIQEKEVEIVQRSRAAELRWSSDKCQESTTGHTINRVLSALESLDKHNFHRCEPLVTLYHKIFDQASGKDGNAQMTKSSEDAVIGLICEWAITAKRMGEHRAAVAAKLLDLRQVHYEQEQLNLNEPASSTPGNVGQPSSVPDVDTFIESSVQQNQCTKTTPYFQHLLFTFLDIQAPELGNPANAEQLQEFRNLVLLFSEFIEHDVFAYDQYINMLISRGDISPGQISSLPLFGACTPQSDFNVSVNSNIDPSLANSNVLGSELKHGERVRLDSSHDNPNSIRSYPEPKMETGELDLLSNQESVFSPDSRGDRHYLDAVRPIDQKSAACEPQTSNTATLSNQKLGSTLGYGQPRHVQYIMHFPLPYENDDITYDWNQRLMVLYGAGRLKSTMKRAVRKVTRHLVKLIQNKLDAGDMIDYDQSQAVSWLGGNTVNHSNKPSSNAKLLYRSLSYFDQHMVTSNVAKTLLAALDNYISGRSSNLPNLKVIVLLFDMMEEALNISGMVRTAVSVCTSLAPLAMAVKRNIYEPNTINSKARDAWYSTELSHIVVAILRHYHSYLTLNMDLTLETFDALFSLAKQSFLSSPTQCTSPDRIILVFLYDLYGMSSKIRLQFADTFGNYVASVRQALCSSKKPAASNCAYDLTFLREFIENPEVHSPLSVAERFCDLLRDPSSRYSFVCSTVISVCSGQQNLEKVNALAGFCAEMNARCSELNAEWLGVLKALCFRSSCTAYTDVFLKIEASDSVIRGPLALFTAVLIARGCLTFSDVIKHVAIPSLLRRCQMATGVSNLDTGLLGERLTCHLLLQLFKTPNSVNCNSGKYSFRFPSSSDRHLFAAAQHNIEVGALLAVLKSLLKLGVTGHPSDKSLFPHDGEDNDGAGVTSFFAPINDFDDFDMMDVSTNNDKNRTSLDEASLSEFAKHCARFMCAQQWVRERCLKDPDLDHLMDTFLTREERQNLIQLIIYPEEELKHRLATLSEDPRSYVVSILSDMTRWTLRQCVLELQAMLCESPQEKSLPEHIAKATIEVFQLQQQQHLFESTRERKSLTGPELDRCNVWLVAPLVSKLPSQVQGRVLQEASAILEAPQNWSCTSTRSSSSTRSDRCDQYGESSLLNHQPFLALILTCLKGQHEQRDSLLESLQSQIIMLHTKWHSALGQRDGGKDVPYIYSSQNGVHDALQLRLSLVGGMFDTVQSNSQWTSDVVVLLTRLINSGMVDIQVNAELFHIVYDMIAVLLHHTLGGDEPNRAEGSKREYMNIVKKMKKEIGENQTESARQLRLLLPIQRIDVYIVCCEPIGLLMDIKGNKIPVPVDGNHGLQVASRQKLNVWEIIEGLKNPAPLCFAWFGARKTERKPLLYEQEHALLLHHEHGNKRNLNEFLQPPQLPPEEEELVEPLPTQSKVSERKSSVVKPEIVGATSSARSDEIKRPQKVPKSKRQSRSRGAKISEQGSQPYGRPHPNVTGGSNTSGGNVLHPSGHPSQVNSYSGYNANNPPSYGAYQTTTNLSQFSATSGFTAPTNRTLPATPTKVVLGNHLRSRSRGIGIQARPNALINSGNYSENLPRSLRQKPEGMKGGVHPAMYNPQQRQTIQQGIMGNQPSNSSYSTYNLPQNTQPGLMQNYNQTVYRSNNNPGAQISYQHQNVGAGQPSQYINRQLHNPNYGMQQNYGGQQQTMVGMQSQNQQPQTQYGMSQLHNRTAQMGRMTPQQLAGVHQMNANPGLQGGNINQRQLLEHQQLLSQPQQYGQQLQTNNQQQPSTIMDMRRTMISQQSQYSL